jgi:uncharacterized membrane protein YobD (UPF0266 family)
MKAWRYGMKFWICLIVVLLVIVFLSEFFGAGSFVTMVLMISIALVAIRVREFFINNGGEWVMEGMGIRDRIDED